MGVCWSLGGHLCFPHFPQWDPGNSALCSTSPLDICLVTGLPRHGCPKGALVDPGPLAPNYTEPQFLPLVMAWSGGSLAPGVLVHSQALTLQQPSPLYTWHGCEEALTPCLSSAPAGLAPTTSRTGTQGEAKAPTPPVMSTPSEPLQTLHTPLHLAWALLSSLVTSHLSPLERSVSSCSSVTTCPPPQSHTMEPPAP